MLPPKHVGPALMLIALLAASAIILAVGAALYAYTLFSF